MSVGLGERGGGGGSGWPGERGGRGAGAVMISQLFVLAPNGHTIVHKDYRGDVPKEAELAAGGAGKTEVV